MPGRERVASHLAGELHAIAPGVIVVGELADKRNPAAASLRAVQHPEGGVPGEAVDVADDRADAQPGIDRCASAKRRERSDPATRIGVFFGML